MVQQWRTYFVLTTAYLLLMITWNKKGDKIVRSTGYLVKYNYDSVLRKNKNKKESNISQSSEKYTACESPSPQGRRQSRNKKKTNDYQILFFSSPFNLSLFLTINDVSSFFSA